MPLILNKQTQKKLTHASETIGLPEPAVIDRALDILIVSTTLNQRQQLKGEMLDWQHIALQSLHKTDERIIQLEEKHAKR